MSWLKITMKYDGICIVCNKKMKAKLNTKNVLKKIKNLNVLSVMVQQDA